MRVFSRLAGLVTADGRAALVRVTGVRGSAPREVGATMIVRADGGFFGTIGGGVLEYEVLAASRALLADVASPPRGQEIQRVLGPDLGQCCGGVVTVRVEVFGQEDLGWLGALGAAETSADVLVTCGQADGRGRLIRERAVEAADTDGVIEQFGEIRTPVLLFGAGHVGRALVMALAPLPFAVTWVDARPEEFPATVAGDVRIRFDAEAAWTEAAQGTLVVVMTHSHQLDLALVSRALGDPRCGYVGLIGSASKAARFRRLLGEAGIADTALTRLVCPIGGSRIASKHPAVIAAVIAVELLDQRQRQARM